MLNPNARIAIKHVMSDYTKLAAITARLSVAITSPPSKAEAQIMRSLLDALVSTTEDLELLTALSNGAA